MGTRGFHEAIWQLVSEKLCQLPNFCWTLILSVPEIIWLLLMQKLIKLSVGTNALHDKIWPIARFTSLMFYCSKLKSNLLISIRITFNIETVAYQYIYDILTGKIFSYPYLLPYFYITTRSITRWQQNILHHRRIFLSDLNFPLCSGWGLNNFNAGKEPLRGAYR